MRRAGLLEVWGASFGLQRVTTRYDTEGPCSRPNLKRIGMTAISSFQAWQSLRSRSDLGRPQFLAALLQ